MYDANIGPHSPDRFFMVCGLMLVQKDFLSGEVRMLGFEDASREENVPFTALPLKLSLCFLSVFGTFRVESDSSELALL